MPYLNVRIDTHTNNFLKKFDNKAHITRVALQILMAILEYDGVLDDFWLALIKTGNTNLIPVIDDLKKTYKNQAKKNKVKESV